jgi:hypothetical protein
MFAKFHLFYSPRPGTLSRKSKSLHRACAAESLAPRYRSLKLGFEVAQSSVAKYMLKRCGPASQGWRTFLRNHAPDIAAMDLFVVPTIGFDSKRPVALLGLGRTR